MQSSSAPPDNILTVSEDARERKVISRALRRAGYHVREAASPEEAVRCLRRHHPNLVVLDSEFAKKNGISICEQARTEAGAAVLPIMHVLGGSIDGEAVATALACGADAPVVVPISTPVLLATVQAVLRTHHVEQALEQARQVAEAQVRAAEEAQRQLEAGRSLQQTVLEQLPAGVIVADARTERVVMLNEAAQHALNLPQQADIPFTEFHQHFVGLHPDGRPYETEEWPLKRALHAGEVVFGEEIQILPREAPPLLVRMNAVPVRDSTGEIIAAVVTFLDLTETQQAQRLLEAMFEATPNWLAYLDTDLRFVLVNRVYAETVGLTQESIRDWTFPELFPEAQEAIAGVREVMDTGEPYFLREVPAARPKTLSRPPVDYLDAAALPIKNAQGEVEGIVLSVVDVTEKVRHRQRVEAAEYARAREARLLEIVQAATDNALVYLDRELRFLYLNSAAERMIGRPASEVIGLRTEDLFPRPTALRGMIKQAIGTGEEITLTEFPVPVPWKPELGVHLVDAMLTPVRDAAGEVEGIVISLNDVTEKVRQRERLLEVERARARLAENLNNEIAHRVKNNLAMVSGLLQMQMHTQPDPRLTEMLRDAIARVRTFAHIHEQMYTTQQEQLDVREAMQRVARAAREIYGTATPLDISVRGAHAVYGSRAVTNLSIVANELLTNAIKYGRPEADDKVHIRLRVQARDGTFRLRIWNSGDTLPSGFDAGQQQSMGLRLVWDIVNQYEGRFSLRPVRGGTLAEVELTEEALARG